VGGSALLWNAIVHAPASPPTSRSTAQDSGPVRSPFLHRKAFSSLSTSPVSSGARRGRDAGFPARRTDPSGRY
jgi:hypothetical protein